MNWGKSIVLAFVLFALFIGSLVTVCLRQDIPLVTANYYENELRYQQQLDRMNNVSALTERPDIQVVGTAVEIRYAQLSGIANGELELFRPSDARLDRKFVIEAKGTLHRIELGNMPGGMYKARMTWAADGKEYYMESIIYL